MVEAVCEKCQNTWDKANCGDAYEYGNLQQCE